MLPAKIDSIWASHLRGEDKNVKNLCTEDVQRTDDGRQVMTKAHMGFGQVS